MTQPLDRFTELSAQGEIDVDAGEFWVENPFQMISQEDNLSAFETNKVYLNLRGERFIDLSYGSSADIDSDSRAVVVADFNRDGASDLLIGNAGGGSLRLFLNRIPQTLHRVRLELRGVESNHDAIGARVTARCGDQQIVRDLFPNNGFMGQSPPELILGVGQAELIDELTIRWPSGQVQSFRDVPIDCGLKITEGNAAFEQTELRL